MDGEEKHVHTIEIARPTGPRVLPPLAGESRGYLAKYVPYHTIDRVKSGAVATASVLRRPKVIAVGSSLALAVVAHVAISSMTHGFSSLMSQASILLTGAGAVQSAGGGAFTGPLDVTPSAVAWWGLQAASSAKRGTKVANVCNSTGGVDVGCADMLSDAVTGALVSQTISSITCPGANCTIKTLYDQSGSLSCSGATACDLTQATVANRPTLPAALARYPASSSTALGTSSFTSSSQPFTISVTSKNTATDSFNQIIGDSSTTGLFFGASSGQSGIFAGSVVNFGTTATLGNYHVFQGFFNGASSTGSIDGTNFTGLNPGSAGYGSGFTIGNGGFYSPQDFLSGGVWAGDKSANFATMSTNQHSFWGF